MKRILCMVCIFAMVISLCNIAVFASETESDVITITSAEEFVANITKDSSEFKTYIIDGTDDLGNNIKGIDLTKLSKAYTSPTAFYGKIKGKNGNGIKINGGAVISTIGANGPTIFENLIIVGDDITRTDDVGALVNKILGSTDPNCAVSFKDITNYVNVSTSTASKNAGGLLGTSAVGRIITFENCVNRGNISSSAGADNSAAGIAGNCTKGSVTFTSCTNHGIIVSSGMAAGILGRRQTASTDDYINKCANYGTVTSTTNTAKSRGAAGIAGCFMNISDSFNAGDITSSSEAGGILAYTTSNNVIENCFNIGSVEYTGTDTSNYPSGIIGSYYNYTVVTVKNSYNAGTIKGTTGTTPKQIGVGKGASAFENNYYVSDTDLGESTGTAITKADLAKLPAPFDADPWEENVNGTFYSLPQIKNNTYYAAEEDGWYIVITDPNAEFNNTQSFSPDEVNDEDYEQYGDYSVVLTKINLTGIEDAEITEFGMYLLDANGNYLDTAEGDAGKRIDGVFGILFYGNKFENGATYKAEPYIKVGDAEYKGKPVKFQIADAE